MGKPSPERKQMMTDIFGHHSDIGSDEITEAFADNNSFYTRYRYSFYCFKLGLVNIIRRLLVFEKTQ